MKETNEKILKQKEELATKALQIAEDSLELLQDQIRECGTRDLVTVFNSAVKAHRDLVADIVSLSDPESEKEKSLAKEYNPTVEKLLKKLDQNS